MMNLRSESKGKRWIFAIFEIRVSFQKFFLSFSNFHSNSPFNPFRITFDDDYGWKREGLCEFTWICLEVRTTKDPALVLDRSDKLYGGTENKSVLLTFSFADSEQTSIISSSLFPLPLWSYDSPLQWWIHAWIAGERAQWWRLRK